MYDAYIFDLDGTIYLGDRLLPGAAETLAALRAASRKTMFLSNNPTRTRLQYVSKLKSLGIFASLDQIVNSSLALVEWLQRNAPKARLFVVGEAPLKQELQAADFILSDDAQAVDIVVASFDRTFSYAKLQIAFNAIRAGARLVATNPDRFCPVPGGGEPDAAAMIAAIEACTGVRCDPIVGKPSPIMVETVMQRLGLCPQQCLMIGDRLETDIAMGLAAGMDTCLVLTGDATRTDLERSGMQPTYVLEHIDELLQIEL